MPEDTLLYLLHFLDVTAHVYECVSEFQSILILSEKFVSTLGGGGLIGGRG